MGMRTFIWLVAALLMIDGRQAASFPTRRRSTAATKPSSPTPQKNASAQPNPYADFLGREVFGIYAVTWPRTRHRNRSLPIMPNRGPGPFVSAKKC